MDRSISSQDAEWADPAHRAIIREIPDLAAGRPCNGPWQVVLTAEARRLSWSAE